MRHRKGRFDRPFFVGADNAIAGKPGSHIGTHSLWELGLPAMAMQ